MKYRHRLFIQWLVSPTGLRDISSAQNLSRRTLTLWFKDFWQTFPQPTTPTSLSGTYLVVDAVYLAGHHECVLIGRTGKGHVFWLFAPQETLCAWISFFSKLPKPRAVICDGQSGLLSALKTVWPDVRMQRCLTHIQRLSIQKLTRRPHTLAGQELLSLTYALHGVKTMEQRDNWVSAFQQWASRWDEFLKERSKAKPPHDKRKWWYVHRPIRALRRTLEQSLPNLFAFIDCPGLPSTTNLVEGGINSRLKELLHRHRGMNLEHKKTLVAYFLNSKSMPQKPTLFCA